MAILEASANATYHLDFNDIAGESPSKDDCSGEIRPMWLYKGAETRIAQFTQFYYNTFDDGRQNLAALYVRG